MNKSTVSWPDFTLPPINLWVLPPADWFYRLRKETVTKTQCQYVDLFTIHEKHSLIHGQRKSR